MIINRTAEDLANEVVSLRDGIRWYSDKKLVEDNRLGSIQDQLEILRRSAERGIKFAQSQDKDSIYIDLWQHQLDEVNRTLEIANKQL
jgi:hypothetical protein